MPRCKNYKLDVPKFYRFQALDHIMFGYVQGIRKALPSMTLAKAILLFLESFEIDEDTYCYDNARFTYYRMLNAIVDMNEKGKPDENLIF